MKCFRQVEGMACEMKYCLGGRDGGCGHVWGSLGIGRLAMVDSYVIRKKSYHSLVMLSP
jgi:hypothetical protein